MLDYLKDNVYATKPKDIEELKDRIKKKVETLNAKPKLLENVMNLTLERVKHCNELEGKHLENIEISDKATKTSENKRKQKVNSPQQTSKRQKKVEALIKLIKQITFFLKTVYFYVGYNTVNYIIITLIFHTFYNQEKSKT